MTLSASYYQSNGRIPDFFKQIREAQAPDQITQQLIKDWGFTSSNDRALIPLLKSIGFLSSDGRPTDRYHNYRNSALSKKVLGEALLASYSDIFQIKSNPTNADKELIQGKFKSALGATENTASLMMKTFYALLEIADLEATEKSPQTESQPNPTENQFGGKETTALSKEPKYISGLHYNIQIHLPATKDVEVYNAIFKSLKEHLIE